MSPYDLEEAIRKADDSVSNSKFADKALITETFLLMRLMVRHAAEVEADRRIDALNRSPQGSAE